MGNTTTGYVESWINGNYTYVVKDILKRTDSLPMAIDVALQLADEYEPKDALQFYRLIKEYWSERKTS